MVTSQTNNHTNKQPTIPVASVGRGVEVDRLQWRIKQHLSLECGTPVLVSSSQRHGSCQVAATAVTCRQKTTHSVTTLAVMHGGTQCDDEYASK